MNDPLAFFFTKYGFDKNQIREVVTGKKYTAVMLQNGHSGVCANLNYEVKIPEQLELKISEISSRIIFNAFLNASINPYVKNLIHSDIFDLMEFGKYQKRIMIGFFQPLVKKFDQANIPLKVYDQLLQDVRLSPDADQQKALSTADMIILTATSIFNQSFLKIIKTVKSDADIFMLRPSSILSKKLFDFKNIKGIFGVQFNPEDTVVLDIIQQGGGTKDFLKYAKKVALLNQIKK